MTNKFTIRDMLVYSFLGFTAIFFYYLYDQNCFTILKEIIKEYPSFFLLLVIPIFYLMGHVVMSIDDLIFNGILIKIYPKRFTNVGFWKWYNLIFFGYRNIGLRKHFEITDQDFFKTTDKLITVNKDLYAKAEYYQVMSDLFKGVLLIILISCILDLTNCNFELWKYILLLLIWYRARSFSSYYVRIIKRNI